MRRPYALLCGLLALPCAADSLRWGYGPADAMPYVGVEQQRLDALLVELRDQGRIEQWLEEALRSAADSPMAQAASAR